MQTFASINLTDEDYQLIEANQLGTPLKVYRLKPDLIRFSRIVGWIIFIVGIIVIILAIIPGTAPNPDNAYRDNLPPLLGGVYALLLGGVFYKIRVLQARSTRIVVCEHGLLQISKIIRKNRVDVVYWQNVPPVKKTFGQDYSFYYTRERKRYRFMLTGSYLHIDELVEIIKQRCEEASQQKSRRDR